MKTFIQIEPDFIQTSETHADGSFTSGIIRRFETKSRQRQDGTEEVSTGFDEEGVEQFGTQPKFITETYSPWDELDPDLVTWLIIPDYLAEQAEAAALASFKASRETSIQTKVVNANGHLFHADTWSKTQMSEAIAVLLEDGAIDTTPVNWSLSGTGSGVMTSITFADLKLARKKAQIYMSEVWAVPN
jgi:hypothetical protein